MSIYIRKYYGVEKGGNRKYYLEICEGRRIDRIAYHLYHAYDSRVPIKIPGWLRFEKWLGERFDAEAPMMAKIFSKADTDPRWVDRLYGWTVAQDFRCFQLSTKYRRVARIEITSQEYKEVKAHHW